MIGEDTHYVPAGPAGAPALCFTKHPGLCITVDRQVFEPSMARAKAMHRFFHKCHLGMFFELLGAVPGGGERSVYVALATIRLSQPPVLVFARCSKQGRNIFLQWREDGQLQIDTSYSVAKSLHMCASISARSVGGLSDAPDKAPVVAGDVVVLFAHAAGLPPAPAAAPAPPPPTFDLMDVLLQQPTAQKVAERQPRPRRGNVA